ncbi:MAG: hypothetical protein EOP04_32335, partial [Proteobacteria bacterium]
MALSPWTSRKTSLRLRPGDFIGSVFIFLNIIVFAASVLLLTQAWPYRRMEAIRYLLLFGTALCLTSFFSLNVYMASGFEDKVMFSRLRFLGLAFIAPAGLLFFASILQRWLWLRNNWIRTSIFLPAILTSLMVFDLLDRGWLVFDYAPVESLGVSVLSFKGGTWFPIYFVWTHILTFLVLFLFLQTALLQPKKRKDLLILSSGVIAAGAVDIACVYLFPTLRWLMLSAGTFSIIELSI